MKLAANQAYFFPYLGFFQLIESVDRMLLYEYVTFRKKSWMTRNRLLDPRTFQPFHIGIPVRGGRSGLLIESVGLTPDYANWQQKFLRRLRHTYRRARYYGETGDFIEASLNKASKQNLHRFNASTIQAVADYLSIATVIEADNTLLANRIEPTLKTFDPAEARKTARIVAICHYHGATTYVNLPNGRALYRTADFTRREIKLAFLFPNLPAYPQFGGPFVSHLSIIDVLMHEGREGTRQLLNTYQLNYSNQSAWVG